MVKIGSDRFVTLKEDTHQYFDTNGQEYKSVSSLLGKVKMPFDRQTISMRKAQSNLPGASQADLLVEQQRLLKEWDDMRISSTDWGNFVHNNLDSYFTIGNCDARVLPAGKTIAKYFQNADSFLPEVVVYDSEYYLAGTFDFGVLRIKGSKPSTTVMDLFDFKTNERRGIEFDSSYLKEGKYVPGKKFLLPPMDHLEECNFNIYSMQLSIYALMIQKSYGVKIGRLGIIFINKQMEVNILPVPYMKYEAMQLFEFSRELKSLP